MTKKKVSENSLKNLQMFTENTAREFGARGGKAKKANELTRLAHKEAKERIIKEAYGQILEKLENGELNNQELISVFKSAVDISGDKTEKQEIMTPEALTVNVVTKED